jgi:hypothetical protein
VSAGAPGIDAIVEEGNENLGQCLLDLGEISHPREARAKDIELTGNLGGVCAALVVGSVEVAKRFAAKGGRTTEDTIGLAMGTGRTRHDASKKRAIRFSPFAIRESQARIHTSRRYAFGKSVQRSGDYAPLTVNRSRGLRPEAIERETKLPNHQSGKLRERIARDFCGILLEIPVLGK